MAKITIQRIFETTKALSTEAGQSLADFINFNAQFAEITLRALRNGLTYADNIDCEIKIIEVSDDTLTVISLSGTRRPTEIRVRRVLNPVYILTQPLAWGFTSTGKVYVQAKFSPAPTTPQQLEIIVLY